MRCMFSLRPKCIVIDRCFDAKTINPKIDCTKIADMYIQQDFVKTYCAYCIKSIYARAKKALAEKEVFVSL